MKLAENHSLKAPSCLRLALFLLTLFFAGFTGRHAAVAAIAPNQPLNEIARLEAQAQEAGTVRVLVQLDMPFFRPEGDLENARSIRVQQLGIDGLQDSVLNQLDGTNTAVVAAYKYIPYLALELDAAALETLAGLPQVVAIEEDIPVPPALSSSIPVIGANEAWAGGYTGVGQTVAILDTGVDTDHTAFTVSDSRIVAEGCYSTTNAAYGATTVCPGGVEESTAVGSGVDCTNVVGAANGKAQSDCGHGTHVASIAAGNDGNSIVGVAPDANIITIQIFSLFNNTAYCSGYSNCVLTFTSDQIAALERVYELRNTYNIASVNMSLGGGGYSSPCDSDSRKAAIDNLRAAGIATVIASGNNGYRDGLSAPACISSAISVGATDDADNVAFFTNVAPFLDLLAPGVGIYAAVPGGASTKQGTSMATPHVAGAWALFKQAVPGASVDEVLAAFQTGAVWVNDDRSGGVETGLSRIYVNKAINAYVTGLTIDVTGSASYLLPGDTIDFTIEVRNDTGIVASDVELTAPLLAPFALQMDSLSGDALVANNEILWSTGQTLNPGQSLIRTVSFVVAANAMAGEITFVATADSPDMDEMRQDTAVLNINEVVSCGFSDGFETGVLSSAWETAVTEEGRVRILTDIPNNGNYSLVLDDSVAGAAKSEAALILTADLTGQAEAALNFSWHDLGDEYDANYDGLFVREQPGDAWISIYAFTGDNHDVFQNAQVDLKEIALANGLELTSRFQMKFGFFDNFPFNPGSISAGDGYAIDDVSLTCVPKGLHVTQQIDNLNPGPGDAITFQIFVTNNETITATNAMINFIMADGLLLNGEVVVDGATAVNGGTPPLLASGINIGPGQQIVITIPTIVAENLVPGTVLEIIITVSSNEFGTPSPTIQSIIVNAGSHQVFIPFVIR